MQARTTAARPVTGTIPMPYRPCLWTGKPTHYIWGMEWGVDLTQLPPDGLTNAGTSYHTYALRSLPFEEEGSRIMYRGMGSLSDTAAICLRHHAHGMGSLSDTAATCLRHHAVARVDSKDTLLGSSSLGM